MRVSIKHEEPLLEFFCRRSSQSLLLVPMRTRAERMRQQTSRDPGQWTIEERYVHAEHAFAIPTIS